MDVYIRRYLANVRTYISLAQGELRRAKVATCSHTEDWPNLDKLMSDLEKIKARVAEESR